MKYFTAKLYADINSRDLEAADSADERWDQAERGYDNRLKQIRPRLSEIAETLADKICLHDAQLIQLWHADSQLVLWVGSELSGYVLRYHTVEPPKLGTRRKSAPFSQHGVRWLYDEIDVPRDGVFSHDILLSDGREIRVVFDDCLVVETHSLKFGPIGSSKRSPRRRKKSLATKR